MSKLLFTIKHQQENKEIRCIQQKWNKGKYYNLRIWYFDEERKDWFPTKQGIVFTKLTLREFIKKASELKFVKNIYERLS